MLLFIFYLIFYISLYTKEVYLSRTNSEVISLCKTDYKINSENKINDYIEDDVYIKYIYDKLKSSKQTNSQNTNLKPKKNREKIIYLTFDDGPSKLTLDVLKVLDQYDIKATFFVVGSNVKVYPEVIVKLKEHGHAIGLHSYTHNYKHIYANHQNFIDEMIATQTLIYNITQEKVDIIRFPGGSYKRLNKDFYCELKKYNFKIYDWNISSQDGISSQSDEDTILKSATENSSRSNIILLMHCRETDKKTLHVLPKIIEFYKSKGYKFETINQSTPEYIFPFK